MQGEQTGDIDKFKHTWGPFRSQSAARVCFAEGKVSSASLCAHTHFKKEVLPRCNPHREHGLSSDIKGHGEAAGRKWHVSRAPGGVCIWKEDKEEQEVCLRVRKDDGLPKSEPVPDRRSPHSVTLHQPHFTRQIYLPGPSPSCHFHWKSLFFLLLLTTRYHRCPHIVKVDSSGPAVLMMSRLIPNLLLGVKRAVLVFLLLPATCRGTAAFPVRVSCVGEPLVRLTCGRS